MSDLSNLTPRPVADCTASEVADALTRSFQGYIVPIQMTPHQYERRFRGEHLDPYASRVFFRDGAPAGLILVARRGWTSRIAGMGLAPELRGQGLGRAVMEEVLEEARARRDRAVLLEVFEKNAPAVRLYEKLGFRALRRLVGYRREGAGPGEGADAAETLVELDPAELARVAFQEAEPDLPWMLAPETLAAAARPARAFHLERRAFALISDPGAEKVALTAVVVPREHRRQGWGSRLVRALEAAFPGRSWVVSPIVPEGLAPGFLPRLGWEPWDLAQLEMWLELG